MSRSLSFAISLTVVLAALAAPIARADFKVPVMTGPIVDQANMIDANTTTLLDRTLRALVQSGGSQIALLTVPDLGGESIEQASIKVAETWQLGTEKDDKGVLLMIVRDERKLRIEVGQGLEGDLTDARSRRIIDESMAPLLRSGDPSSAALVGIYEIIRVTDPNFDIQSLLNEGSALNTVKGRSRTNSGGGIVGYLIFFLIILPVFLAISQGPRHRYRRGWHGGGWGGGSWGGGGFGRGGGLGGGGWGGGGGGFSGGGSSGSW